VLNEERRRAIVELVNRDGRVLVADLSKQFATSQVTIRKDLELLHGRGLLHRSHGGALTSREGAIEDPSLGEKEQLHRKEKLHIASAAARFAKEGQVVILDSGTTTTAIARALRRFRNLTIITNAVNIAAELSNTTLDVILTGGTLRKNSFSLVGPIAEETLQHLNADLLFLGVDGFDVEYGLSTPNLLESKVNRVMLEISRHRIAVCDSSKFGRRSLSQIGPASSMHGVITDHAIPKSDLNTLRKSGIEVTLV
jgi:DeoR family transcriptional regulator, aga operon transcriptional repressor